MIISSAMINSKDVLEMKLNGNVVYSASEPSSIYNYTLTFPYSNIPSWFDATKLITYRASGVYGFITNNNSLVNERGGIINGQENGYLGLDLSQCTKNLKITITYSTDTVDPSKPSSRIFLVYGTTLGSFTTVVATIVSTRLNVAQTTATYTLPIATIDTIRSGGYIPQIYLNQYNGALVYGAAYLHIYSIQFEEVD